MTGRVSLYNHDGIVATKRYSCPAHRTKIIDYWKKTYAKGFEKATVRDEPDPVEERSHFKKGDMINPLRLLIPKHSRKRRID